MSRLGRCVAAMVGVAVLATPALSVTIANTQWDTSGKGVVKVKGIGHAKSDIGLVLRFFDGGDVLVEDASARTFAGTYLVVGRRGDKAEISLDTASTTLLENVMESEIEDAVLRRTGQAIQTSVDVTTVRTKALFNRKGTKVQLRLKAKAFGQTDADPRRRKTTYTVKTKGEQAQPQ